MAEQTISWHFKRTHLFIAIPCLFCLLQCLLQLVRDFYFGIITTTEDSVAISELIIITL